MIQSVPGGLSVWTRPTIAGPCKPIRSLELWLRRPQVSCPLDKQLVGTFNGRSRSPAIEPIVPRIVPQREDRGIASWSLTW